MSKEHRKFRVSYEPFPKTRTALKHDGRTMQASKDECDINKIMKRFEKTGILPDLIKSNPQYGDFSDPSTYQEALNTVAMASDQFQSLSARVRERFQNDPQNFLEFATNPANGDEMVRLGLATPRAKEPSPTPPAPPKKAPKPAPPKGDDE